MPCCQWVLSVAESSINNTTPQWLHRLHAKGGLSFPSHLQIDDLLYGQPQPQPSPPPPPPPPPPTLLPPLPPPPPPASPDRRLAVINPQNPPPNPKPPRNPARPNPSANNTYPPPQPQTQTPLPLPPPPPPLSGVISDIFAVPSAPRSSRPPKPFRKQSRPRPRPKDKSDDKDKAKARKRRRVDRYALAVDGERRSKTEVTVIDTSTDGWKAAKLLVRKGTVWKVRDRKVSEISDTEELNRGKRRAGLVAKVQRDKEKEKDAVLPGNIHASSGYLRMVPPGDDAIQTVERPRSSESLPGGQSASILLLPSSSTVSQP